MKVKCLVLDVSVRDGDGHSALDGQAVRILADPQSVVTADDGTSRLQLIAEGAGEGQDRSGRQEGGQLFRKHFGRPVGDDPVLHIGRLTAGQGLAHRNDILPLAVIHAGQDGRPIEPESGMAQEGHLLAHGEDGQHRLVAVEILRRLRHRLDRSVHRLLRSLAGDGKAFRRLVTPRSVAAADPLRRSGQLESARALVRDGVTVAEGIALHHSVVDVTRISAADAGALRVVSGPSAVNQARPPPAASVAEYVTRATGVDGRQNIVIGRIAGHLDASVRRGKGRGAFAAERRFLDVDASAQSLLEIGPRQDVADAGRRARYGERCQRVLVDDVVPQFDSVEQAHVRFGVAESAAAQVLLLAHDQCSFRRNAAVAAQSAASI